MSGDPRERIPSIIGGGRVLLYSRIDTRHQPRQPGQSKPYGLAICEQEGAPGVFLFTCDDDWMPLFDSWHLTLVEAKRQAEFEWIGIATAWKEPPT